MDHSFFASAAFCTGGSSSCALHSRPFLQTCFPRASHDRLLLMSQAVKLTTQSDMILLKYARKGHFVQKKRQLRMSAGLTSACGSPQSCDLRRFGVLQSSSQRIGYWTTLFILPSRCFKKQTCRFPRSPVVVQKAAFRCNWVRLSDAASLGNY